MAAEDLEEDIWDLGVWPNSCNRDSDTNVPVPLALVAVAASVAVEEIFALLRDVPMMHPQCWSTPEHKLTPELLGPIDTEVKVGVQAPLRLQQPPRTWLQVELPLLGSAEGRMH